MKISSPIGNVPFTPNSIKIGKGVLIIDGSMGAWPVTIQIEPSDIPRILYLIRYLIVITIILLIIIVLLVI